MSMHVLAIAGSLRANSSNARVLQALARYASPSDRVSFWEGLGDLPHFNPDLDREPAHAAVAAFRAVLREADAVVISSPEYAHGVPGSLKNALDWVVGSGEFIDKPVALINASQQATHSYAALWETLTTMSAAMVREASVTIPLRSNQITAEGIASDPQFSSLLQGALAALAAAVHRREA